MVLATDYFVMPQALYCAYATSGCVPEIWQVLVRGPCLSASTKKKSSSYVAVVLANCVTACCSCSILIAVNPTSCDVVLSISF